MANLISTTVFGTLTATQFVDAAAIHVNGVQKDGIWDDAYALRVTAVSGDGNSTLTLTRPDTTNLTTNLSHTHPASQVTAGTFTGDYTFDGSPTIDLIGHRLNLNGTSGTNRDAIKWRHGTTDVWTNWIDGNGDLKFERVSGTGIFRINTPLHITTSIGGEMPEGMITIQNTGTGGESAIRYINADIGSNRWYGGLNQGTEWRLAHGTSFTNANTRLTLTTSGNLTLSGTISATGYNNTNWDDAHTHISSDGSSHSHINQSVTTGARPTFIGVAMSTAQTRDKLRVWSNGTYSIGMKNGYTFGGLSNDYAMSFQFSNTNSRGFWWGDDAHTDAQGAMALTTDGKLTVAYGIRVGYGEGDTTTPGATYRVQVSGATYSTGISYASDHQDSSDSRIKEIIEDYVPALDIAKHANLKYFDKRGEKQYGLIAQDLMKYDHRLVGTAKDEEFGEIYTLSPYSLASIALSGVKELDENKAEKSELDNLRNKVSELEEKIIELGGQI